MTYNKIIKSLIFIKQQNLKLLENEKHIQLQDIPSIYLSMYCELEV